MSPLRLASLMLFVVRVQSFRATPTAAAAASLRASSRLAKPRASRCFATSVPDDTFSVAPMMDYTDRHLRYMLRLISKRATLWTEMVTANTLVYNDELDRWLEFNKEEHPVVLQLGGNSAEALSTAVANSLPYGYDGINLNCGCPSDKVSGKGAFGAALMRDPARVADLCKAMADKVNAEQQRGSGGPAPAITVKCRIGVVARGDMEELLEAGDDVDYASLAAFVREVSERGGVEHFVVHARKAVLGGLSPDANRKVPPLKHAYVHRLVADFPSLKFTVNGGLGSVEDCVAQLKQGVHGVMLGRAVVSRPWHLMSLVDEHLYHEAPEPGAAPLTRRSVLEAYGAYGEGELAKCRAHQPGYTRKLRRAILRHAANLFAGEPHGARFRQRIDAELHADKHDPACPAGVVSILTAACSELRDETLDAPPPLLVLQSRE